MVRRRHARPGLARRGHALRHPGIGKRQQQWKRERPSAATTSTATGWATSPTRPTRTLQRVFRRPGTTVEEVENCGDCADTAARSGRRDGPIAPTGTTAATIPMTAEAADGMTNRISARADWWAPHRDAASSPWRRPGRARRHVSEAAIGETAWSRLVDCARTLPAGAASHEFWIELRPHERDRADLIFTIVPGWPLMQVMIPRCKASSSRDAGFRELPRARGWRAPAGHAGLDVHGVRRAGGRRPVRVLRGIAENVRLS